MELNVRRITENDWDTLKQWWKDWGFEFIPSKDFLPDNGTGGLIVEKHGEPIVSTFMYTTNSGVCALGWPLSNKNYKSEDRAVAVEFLNKACEEMWKAHGGKFLFFWGDNKKYIDCLKQQGFNEGDNNYSHLIKQI